MKNLFNCHSVGLHSFPVSFENGLYRRIFYAESNHRLWKPFEIAVHPHHVNIKITVLEGKLYNPLYMLAHGSATGKKSFTLKKFKWNSHILSGKGGFEYLGEQTLVEISNHSYQVGESFSMTACELHTIQIPIDKMCAWLVEESVPTCDSFPINYSPNDLTKWSPDGLYIEVDDTVRDKYIGKYLDQFKIEALKQIKVTKSDVPYHYE